MSNDILKNAGLEKSVLSGIAKYGSDLLIEIEDILCVKDFAWSINQKIYSLFKHLYHEKSIENFDIPTIISCSKFIDETFLSTDKEKKYIEAIFDDSPNEQNIKSIAIAVYKLSVARQANKSINNVLESINKITGEEKIEDIVSLIEEPILQFTSSLNSSNNSLVHISDNFESTIEALSEAPKDIIGIPTGFSNWDFAIGGGLRRGTVNVIGARPKRGKSNIALNIGKNVSEQSIPVLYLDTEMTQAQQMNRLISLLSGININRIETGQFSKIKEENDAVWSIKDKIENLCLTHCSIAGYSPDATLSICRRWLAKNVGFQDNGLSKPCLIIYDYIKLMDSEDLKTNRNMQETQLLGFLITALHNFALKWSVPILATVQLNRDGVEKEGGEFVAGSDRILWLCSNFTILKDKTKEDYIEDPMSNGNKKLIVTDTRFGEGLERGNYINIKADLGISTMLEGNSFSHNAVNKLINEKI